jgi:hypothetical protein
VESWAKAEARGRQENRLSPVVVGRGKWRVKCGEDGMGREKESGCVGR